MSADIKPTVGPGAVIQTPVCMDGKSTRDI